MPLDPDSKEPHHFEESFNAWRKEHPLICQYCNEAKIYFDDKLISKNGKCIPLEANKGEVHDCPESPFHRERASMIEPDQFRS